MNVYVIHGNSYYEEYGYIENIFGVFIRKDAAEEARNRVKKDLFEKEMKKTYTTVKKISDIEVNILEIETDELVNFELGGYCE